MTSIELPKKLKHHNSQQLGQMSLSFIDSVWLLKTCNDHTYDHILINRNGSDSFNCQLECFIHDIQDRALLSYSHLFPTGSFVPDWKIKVPSHLPVINKSNLKGRETIVGGSIYHTHGHKLVDTTISISRNGR